MKKILTVLGWILFAGFAFLFTIESDSPLAVTIGSFLLFALGFLIGGLGLLRLYVHAKEFKNGEVTHGISIPMGIYGALAAILVIGRGFDIGGPANWALLVVGIPLALTLLWSLFIYIAPQETEKDGYPH